MASPWQGRTGWAKSVAISATVLLVSLGLCGLNYGAFAVFNLPMGEDPRPGHETAAKWGGVLILSGLVELGGMVLGGFWLLVSLIGLAIDSVRPRGGDE